MRENVVLTNTLERWISMNNAMQQLASKGKQLHGKREYDVATVANCVE